MNFTLIRHFLLISTLVFISHINVVIANDAPMTKVVIGVAQAPEHSEETQYHRMMEFIKAYWLYWGEQYQYQVSFAVYPLHEMQSALMRRDIDIISSGFYEPLKQPNFLFSIPYLGLKTILYRHVNAKDKNTTISVLEPRFFQTEIGNRLKRKLVRNSNRLFSSEPDYVWSWSPLIAEFEYQKSIYYGNYVSEYLDEKIPIRAITRYFERNLMLDINKGIRELSRAKLEALWRQLLTSDSNDFELLAGNYTQKITQQSHELLVNNPVLTFAYIRTGSAPYFIENEIDVKGYYIDYLEALSKSTGVTFTAKSYDTFREALVALKKQEVDILPGLFKTDNRSNYVSFTHAIDQAQLAIVGYDNYNSIKKLKGIPIAVVRGLHETTILKRYLSNSQMTFFTTAEEAMKALANREVEAYFGNILNIANLMSTTHVSNAQIYKVDDLEDDLALRIGVNKNNRQLVNLLNIGIQDLGVDFQKKLHLGWQQALLTSQDNTLQQRLVNKIITFSVIVIIIFTLLFSFYQWQLRQRREQQLRVEKALQESKVATEKAVVLAKSKTEFLARMSHEIRTPMNGVLGMAEALTFTDLSPDQQDLLDTLNSSARNLMALLNDVLDFSKMDAGKLTLEALPAELNVILQGVMDTFRHKAESSGLNFNLFIDENLNGTYLIDGVRLMQVINNLVSNSLKFTESGYVELRAQLIDDQYGLLNGETQHLIHIEVRDTGIGITANKINTLFDPFVQAEGDITRRFGGTGLGLSICKEIVDEMQGTISVDSKIQFGSVFTVALPLIIVDELPIEKRVEKVTNDAVIQAQLASLNILLAEDNVVNRKVIEGQLKRIGIKNLTSAVNGEEALEMFKQAQYDIVISDCHMPKMDGFSLASELKKLKQAERPWIIALTADALSGAAKRCLEAGFDDYISKPCPSEVLSGKLSFALSKLSNISDLGELTETPLISIQTFDHFTHLNVGHVIDMNEGDEGLIEVIFQAFLQSVDNDCQELKHLVEEKQWQNLKMSAHRIKGCVLYLGAQSLGDIACEIETHALSLDEVILEEKVKILAEALNLLKQEVKAYHLNKNCDLEGEHEVV